MIELNNCRLIAEKGTSKKDKEYYALYFLVNDEKIFLTFITKKVFDNLSK